MWRRTTVEFCETSSSQDQSLVTNDTKIIQSSAKTSITAAHYTYMSISPHLSLSTRAIYTRSALPDREGALAGVVKPQQDGKGLSKRARAAI